MSTNKYKWLTLGLASVVVSGCAVGSKPNLNLGIADAFRKSKSCLFKKKVSYRAPAATSRFGYATPVNSVVTTDQAISSMPCDCCGDCSDSEIVSVTTTESHTPVSPTHEAVDADTTSLPTAVLPAEESQGKLELENPLPAAIEAPNIQASPSLNIDSTEEEGVIETLDSASVDPEEVDEELIVTPNTDEASILDTAEASPETSPEPETPTSAGSSVVERPSKMLTLTARPVQTHHASATQTVKNKAEMQQVTHKRHFRRQNSLRPLHQKFGSQLPAHTAEAPGPIKFKPLPAMSKEWPTTKTSETNTGAPTLNRSPSSETSEQSSSKIQRLPSPVQKLDSETEKESVIKIARLPILRAESTSSAAIGSLRNFTNVRDLDPGFDKGYYSRKNAEAAVLRAAQVIKDDVSSASDDLLIER